MASIKRRPDGVWRARYRDAAGKEHARHFPRKVDAQAWLDDVTASVVAWTYVDPKTARTTVGEWCEMWLAGYATRRASTIRQACVHVAQIVAEFGTMPLSAVRPSHVRSWTSRLRGAGLSESYVYALHARLAQIMSDAVHDGIVPRSPCSRRTSPGPAKQRAYVATTEQVWALHVAMPERLRPAVLLSAFAGLRLAEACGLRVAESPANETVLAGGRTVASCRLRRWSARFARDTYGHLWPDRDESTRAAVEAVLAAHADSLRTVAAQR